MNKPNLKVKSNNFHSKKKKQVSQKPITVKIPQTIKKVSPKIEAIDKKLFLEQIEKFFTNEIIAQSPFDWKSWMPAGRPEKYYHDLLATHKENFLRIIAKKKDETIYVYVIFGAGFNFDLLNYEILKFKRKQLFDQKCILVKIYSDIFSVPTWNHIENDWRKTCHPDFSFKKRILSPNSYWNIERFVFTE
jgi:hypothetical protein